MSGASESPKPNVIEVKAWINDSELRDVGEFLGNVLIQMLEVADARSGAAYMSTDMDLVPVNAAGVPEAIRGRPVTVLICNEQIGSLLTSALDSVLDRKDC